MKFQNYSDKNGLFTLKIPEGWLSTSAVQAGCKVAFVSTDDSVGFCANINVVQQGVSPLTVDEYVVLNRLQLKKMSQSETLQRDEQIRAGVHVFESIIDQGEVPIWMRQQVFFAGKDAFTVSVSCAVGQQAESMEAFEQVLESFELHESQ